MLVFKTQDGNKAEGQISKRVSQEAKFSEKQTFCEKINKAGSFQWASNLVALFQVICVKVFKNGPSKSFKGCLPQILLAPFLNTLTQK